MAECLQKENKINIIKRILEKDDRIVFAYIYGSYLLKSNANDIDIAIYVNEKKIDYFIFPTELKIKMYKKTGIVADLFDIKVINNLLSKGDLFTLLYLKDVFTKGLLIVDKDPDLRTDLFEKYGLKYRECEGLIAEILI